jgi:hypothetical protein
MSISTYILDLNNPRVQKAMSSLSIDSSELIKKTPEDFVSKEISEEIKTLRYNFFVRKQQELIRKIKFYIKDEILRGIEKNEQKKHSNHSEMLLTTVYTNSKENFEKAKNKYQEILNKTFEEAKETFRDTKAIEEKLIQSRIKREQAKAEVSKKRMILLELREKQKENLEKIRKLEKKNLTQYYRASTSNTTTRVISRHKLMNSQTILSNNASNSDIDISEKIEKYEEKMKKSEALYNLYMQSKKEAASRLLERSEKLSKNIENNKKVLIVEKISNLIKKSKTAENRRATYAKEQAKKREDTREKYDERRLRAQTRLKEREKHESARTKAIEKKMEQSFNLLEAKHTSWIKELELRNEFQRLKDEDVLHNAERKKKMM